MVAFPTPWIVAIVPVIEITLGLLLLKLTVPPGAVAIKVKVEPFTKASLEGVLKLMVWAAFLTVSTRLVVAGM